jgi:hypothetical protein
VVYGTPLAIQVARDIIAEILTVQRKAIASPEKAADAAVSAVLQRRGISLDARLQWSEDGGRLELGCEALLEPSRGVLSSSWLINKSAGGPVGLLAYRN